MRVLWEGECVKLGIIVESREQFEPLGTVDAIINGIHREGRQRRGTPFMRAATSRMGILVGAVPSGASARPNSAAS